MTGWTIDILNAAVGAGAVTTLVTLFVGAKKFITGDVARDLKEYRTANDKEIADIRHDAKNIRAKTEALERQSTSQATQMAKLEVSLERFERVQEKEFERIHAKLDALSHGN